MKETVLDVLMFLFENYYGTEVGNSENQDTLREELTAAGFDELEVNHAFSWLQALLQQREAGADSISSGAIRVYAAQEMEKLSTECRGFLHYLEQLGILSATTRELAIERLLALNEEIDVERVKWVCLLVLANQPGEEEGAWHVEDMLFAPGPFLH